MCLFLRFLFVCFALVVLAALMVWAPIACSTACEAAAVSSSARRPSYAFSDLVFQTNVFSILKKHDSEKCASKCPYCFLTQMAIDLFDH